jgi:Holliday junction resolvasome RuvABC endonuclease subunit
MKRILGLDPAGSFGWTVLDDGNYVDGGAAKFKYPTKVQQEKKGIPKGKKWLDAWEWLDATLAEYNPDMVVLEDVRRHVSTLSAHSYGYLRYMVEALCAKHSVEFYPIIVTEWKLCSIGKGNADKDLIAEKMNEKFPHVEFVTDDHSDSAGIAMAGFIYVKEDKLQSLRDKVGGKKKKKKK